jgi:hypothetical protein
MATNSSGTDPAVSGRNNHIMQGSIVRSDVSSSTAIESVQEAALQGSIDKRMDIESHFHFGTLNEWGRSFFKTIPEHTSYHLFSDGGFPYVRTRDSSQGP